MPLRPQNMLIKPLARSSADAPRVPVRRKMASSSASDRVWAPAVISFSRGLSLFGQSAIATLNPRKLLTSPYPLE